MTKQEVMKLLMILKEYYPRDVESTNMETKVNAWYMLLKEYDSNLIMNSALAFVANDTKGFMPTPGQIITKIGIVKTSGNEMTEMEAWSYVSKAIRNSTYHSKEEWEMLPSNIQKCVTPDLLREWAMLEGDEIQTVIQSHFARTYKTKINNIKEFESLPKNVQEFSLKLSEKLKMIENKGE